MINRSYFVEGIDWTRNCRASLSLVHRQLLRPLEMRGQTTVKTRSKPYNSQDEIKTIQQSRRDQNHTTEIRKELNSLIVTMDNIGDSFEDGYIGLNSDKS
ncbi:hypothetical protein RRG08_042740 [Elysia crispata]|uniref:Uncharacterized protein n=1 Tax=Elysia crispata TaxID=231223 RepID=A0AAE1CKR0_9GAST|nr:hypothetical protein RRG08_042740 [Elysia crispata]